MKPSPDNYREESISWHRSCEGRHQNILFVGTSDFLSGQKFGLSEGNYSVLLAPEIQGCIHLLKPKICRQVVRHSHFFACVKTYCEYERNPASENDCNA